jgi:hypothetical protein
VTGRLFASSVKPQAILLKSALSRRDLTRWKIPSWKCFKWFRFLAYYELFEVVLNLVANTKNCG